MEGGWRTVIGIWEGRSLLRVDKSILSLVMVKILRKYKY